MLGLVKSTGAITKKVKKLTRNVYDLANERVVPTIRKPTMVFTDSIPKYWFKNSAAWTHLYNSISISATPTEGYFVRELRKFMSEDIGSPLLKKQVENFIAQESHHSKTHEGFNSKLKEQGYPVREIQQRMIKKLQKFSKNKTPQETLAVVCAGEHFLAEIGHIFLRDDRYTKHMHPEMRELFQWHFYEEVEHKSVAFDAYIAKYGNDFKSYIGRIKGLMVAMLFTPDALWSPVFTLLKHDDKLNVKECLSLFNYFFVNPGLLVRSVPGVLAYFSPWFHPWKYYSDSEALLENMKSVIKAEWETDKGADIHYDDSVDGTNKGLVNA